MKQKFFVKSFLFLLFAFNMLHGLFAQTTQGTEFWLTFPENSDYRSDYSPTYISLELKIIAEEKATVSLSFTDDPSLNTSFTVQAGEAYGYVFSKERRAAIYSVLAATGIKGNTGYETSSKSLQITSTKPITVYAMDQVVKSTDATMVLPVENWGTEYHLISYTAYTGPSSTSSKVHHPKNGYIIIARENGTTVTEYYGTTTVTKTLSKGQVYNGYIFMADMLGRRVVTNKPVAFFSASSESQIPLGRIWADILFQQLPPVSQWGKAYVVPLVEQENRIRVVASQDGTNITLAGSVSATNIVTNTGGKKTLTGLNTGEFVELTLTGLGAYITANKQIGVCSFMTGQNLQSNSYGDPAQTWIAPVEQAITSASMSVFIPQLHTSDEAYSESNLKKHYIVIVTPTATKNETKSGSSVAITSGWTDIANSGYSYIRREVPDNNVRKYTNPNGIIVYAYGIGVEESYYYLTGSAAKDLTPSPDVTPDLTVNGENHKVMNGKYYCSGSDFVFKADFGNKTIPSSITWKLNGQTLSAYQNKTIAYAYDLSDGFYTISVSWLQGSGDESTLSTTFNVAGAVVWTPDANTSGTDTQKQDWNVAANWTPKTIPTACMDVYIPGNSTHYPKLTDKAECRDIYFMQGGELGRPDVLTYRYAYVHFNVGLRQSSQEKETENITNQRNLVIRGFNTFDRLKFSASTSTPLERERWYAISSPLKNVVSGDLGFGGFPLTFMRKFGPIVKDEKNYPVGEWTVPYTDMTEEFAPTEGFGFYVYGYENKWGDNTGTIESDYFGKQNEMQYLPAERSGQEYGIKKLNGILELPFFNNKFNMEGHRTQVYDASSHLSTFYYISDGTLGPFNNLIGSTTSKARESDNGSFRFIPEKYESGKWSFINPINHRTTGLNSGDEFLVGNPYMSSINMVEFCKDNAAAIEPGFRVWNGSIFDTYSVNISTGTVTSTTPGGSPYVAPMQGFFLTYKGSDVKFDVAKISTVRPINNPSNLKSSQNVAEENIFRIKAENKDAYSYTLIGHRDGASKGFVSGEDVQKLFSPYSYVPEIYSLAGEMPVDINFIDNSKDVVIPLGLKTGAQGTIELTFTGMDYYKRSSKIVFVDMFLQKEIDLSKMPSFTYSFENQVQGIQNNRFLLRFYADNTLSLIQPEDNEGIKVYSNKSGITMNTDSSDPIRQVWVYDLQGRKLYEKTLLETSSYLIPDKFNVRQVIVRVVTQKTVKNVNLILTK